MIYVACLPVLDCRVLVTEPSYRRSLHGQAAAVSIRVPILGNGVLVPDDIVTVHYTAIIDIVLLLQVWEPTTKSIQFPSVRRHTAVRGFHFVSIAKHEHTAARRSNYACFNCGVPMTKLRGLVI